MLMWLHSWMRFTAQFIYRNGKKLLLRLDENHAFLLGGGLTFSIFTCILPLVLIIFAVLGNLLEAAAVDRQLSLLVRAVIPYEESGQLVEQVLSTRIQEMIYHKNIASFIGFPALVFAASGLFRSLRTILDKIYRSEEEKSMIRERLWDLLLILVVVVFIAAITLVLPLLEVLKENVDKIPLIDLQKLNFVQDVFLTVVPFLMMFGMFYILYRFVPTQRVGSRVAVVSALCSATLWEIAKQLFGYYISNFATLDRIYGAYILVVVVGFWLYYSSLVFIVGAELGQMYRERREDV